MPSDAPFSQGPTNTEFIGDIVDGRGMERMIRLGNFFFIVIFPIGGVNAKIQDGTHICPRCKTLPKNMKQIPVDYPSVKDTSKNEVGLKLVLYALSNETDDLFIILVLSCAVHREIRSMVLRRFTTFIGKKVERQNHEIILSRFIKTIQRKINITYVSFLPLLDLSHML
jgi:hypothetical protein